MELMKDKPISKITIKEICDLSEMSRSTFYLHYQDSFELLANIEKTSVPDMLLYPNSNYAFTFVMYGAFNVLKVWIQNGFDTPVNELSELIFSLCNNVVK